MSFKSILVGNNDCNENEKKEDTTTAAVQENFPPPISSSLPNTPSLLEKEQTNLTLLPFSPTVPVISPSLMLTPKHSGVLMPPKSPIINMQPFLLDTESPISGNNIFTTTKQRYPSLNLTEENLASQFSPKSNSSSSYQLNQNHSIVLTPPFSPSMDQQKPTSENFVSFKLDANLKSNGSGAEDENFTLSFKPSIISDDQNQTLKEEEEEITHHHHHHGNEDEPSGIVMMAEEESDIEHDALQKQVIEEEFCETEEEEEQIVISREDEEEYKPPSSPMEDEDEDFMEEEEHFDDAAEELVRNEQEDSVLLQDEKKKYNVMKMEEEEVEEDFEDDESDLSPVGIDFMTSKEAYRRENPMHAVLIPPNANNHNPWTIHNKMKEEVERQRNLIENLRIRQIQEEELAFSQAQVNQNEEEVSMEEEEREEKKEKEKDVSFEGEDCKPQERNDECNMKMEIDKDEGFEEKDEGFDDEPKIDYSQWTIGTRADVLDNSNPTKDIDSILLTNKKENLEHGFQKKEERKIVKMYNKSKYKKKKDKKPKKEKKKKKKKATKKKNEKKKKNSNKKSSSSEKFINKPKKKRKKIQVRKVKEYMGVYTRGNGRFFCTARIQNKQKYVGSYSSPKEAALAYDKFVFNYRGENYSSYNYPEKIGLGKEKSYRK